MTGAIRIRAYFTLYFPLGIRTANEIVAFVAAARNGKTVEIIMVPVAHTLVAEIAGGQHNACNINDHIVLLNSRRLLHYIMQ